MEYISKKDLFDLLTKHQFDGCGFTTLKEGRKVHFTTLIENALINNQTKQYLLDNYLTRFNLPAGKRILE